MERDGSAHRTKGLLRLTMACNERCPFCNVPMEDYPERTPPMDEVLAELTSFEGERTLTISGGEPTLLRDRLLTLVREARTRGLEFVELQTNAVLIDDGYARALAEAGVTSGFVSLLSHVPALHDELAGLADAFAPCLRGIDALLDAGVAVTLNPVTARQTQELLPDYVTFVADRLPRVTAISVSAVQPHGRAARHPDLLPDYAVLRDVVPRARAVAAERGVELVNPYCGLPLCVGWADRPDRSVEAIEAEAGWRPGPGVSNRGDKRHGEPCRACSLRTRCGGAWHAYWSERGGSGIEAPARSAAPWFGGGERQEVWTEIADEAVEPTVWLRSDRVPAGLLDSAVTDLALELNPTAAEALTDVADLMATQADRPDQGRLRVHLGLRPQGRPDARAIDRLVGRAAALGVHEVTVIGTDPVWRRLVEALRSAWPGIQVAHTDG